MRWTRRAAVAGIGAGLTSPRLGLAAPFWLGPGAKFGWATSHEGRRLGPSVNADWRFPMCSTFKWLLAACVLSRVDTASERLERHIEFGGADILDYAPTSKAVLAEAGGVRGEMSIDALCEAAVTLSDNTAANLLLGVVGGPAAVTAWLRAHGDRITRLDRVEPALNVVPNGDERDTTTPNAMLGDLTRILFGDVLTLASRHRLMGWLLGCKTGADRLKAGLPAGWRIAHKTGTWTYDPGLKAPQRAASGDVGVLFPPTGKPILIAAYTAGASRPQAEVDAWFASLARTATGNRT